MVVYLVIQAFVPLIRVVYQKRPKLFCFISVTFITQTLHYFHVLFSLQTSKPLFFNSASFFPITFRLTVNIQFHLNIEVTNFSAIQLLWNLSNPRVKRYFSYFWQIILKNDSFFFNIIAFMLKYHLFW